jgi:inosine/xanthosine triphosphatase
MKVAIGSTNPVKVGAARAMILRVWPEATIIAVEVKTGVRAMPMSDGECQAGARNRARAARQLATADLGIGIEGGVHEENGVLMLTAWTVIVNGDGQEGLGGSGRLPLPSAIAARVRAGEELGHVMDDVLDERNIKQKGGAVGALTAGLVLRQEALALSVAYALAPFVAPQLFLWKIT